MGEESPTSRGSFGRYVLGPELGSGGMATVSFGVVRGALGFARPVAIKRIHPSLARDADLIAAIRDEARIAARVRHPNVVSVIDVIEERESVGIVLEYVHGEALSSLLRTSLARASPVPVGVAVAVIVDVLHGLHAAHTAKDETGRALDIVHRDISPQNVLVGADGIARVLDFGISKAEHRSSVTRDGHVKGKLRYMAPEQLGGEATPAADTYAAGLILWETLAGRSPFDDVGDSVQLVARVLTGVSVAPSTYAKRTVPPILDAIVERALAVGVTERFASAAQMAEALESTGLVDSRTAVASWVNDLARQVLAARAEVVTLLERGLGADRQAPPVASEKTSAVPVVRTPEAPRPPTRLLPWTLVVALALIASWFALGSLRARVSTARSDEAPPPTSTPAAALVGPSPQPQVSSPMPVSSPVPAPVPAPVPIPSAVGVTSTRPPGKPPKRGRPGAVQPDCTTPYTVDANGDHHYRRECFE